MSANLGRGPSPEQLRTLDTFALRELFDFGIQEAKRLKLIQSIRDRINVLLEGDDGQALLHDIVNLITGESYSITMATPVPAEEAEAQRLARVHALLVEELELSVRAVHCLLNDNIVTLGDLVTRTESDLKRVPNLGRRTLNEIKELMDHFGIELSKESV